MKAKGTLAGTSLTASGKQRGTVAALVAILAGTAFVLYSMGRIPWCKCGSPVPWSWQVWSMHNSQHLVDPYAFSHVQHGLLFYGLLHTLFRGRAPAVRLLLAIALEAGWEIVENSAWLIARYRETTMSLDYFGDSIVNSLGDILACGVGYALAAALPTRLSIALLVTIELAMVLWIRDSLLLNVLMLVFPIDVIKVWQMGAG